MFSKSPQNAVLLTNEPNNKEIGMFINVHIFLNTKGLKLMTEQDKGTRKMVYFKSEERYKLFKEICKELDTNISERLNALIDEDIDKMIACLELYKKSIEKEIEKNA